MSTSVSKSKSALRNFGTRQFGSSHSSFDKIDYRNESDEETAELDDYLAEIAKKRRKGKKKIDWSKVFENDDLTGVSDVKDFKPSNEIASLKTAQPPSVTKATVTVGNSDDVSSISVCDTSSLNLSDVGLKSDALLGNSVRPSVQFVDSCLISDDVENDSNGDDSLGSPVALNVYAIEELLSSSSDQEDESIASDNINNEGFIRLGSLLTVDDLNPIEDESNQKLGDRKSDECKFDVVMTVDQLENVCSASEELVASKKSEDSLNTSPMKMDVSDHIITEEQEQASSTLTVDDRLLRNTMEETVRSEQVSDYEYTESFASDSQGPSSNYQMRVGSCSNLADPTMQSIAKFNSTSQSLKVDDSHSQTSQSERETALQEGATDSGSPAVSCEGSSQRQATTNLVDDQEIETERNLSDVTSLDDSNLISKRQMVECGTQTDSNQFSLPAFSSPKLVGHGHGQVTIEPSVLGALCSHTPAALALHELMKEQLVLTKSFVARCSRLASALRDECKPDYQYTTLETTKEYIRKHKPRVRTMEEAMKEVTRKK